MNLEIPKLPPASLQGRVALVTGANTGIGRVTAWALAQAGAHVFLACRSKERAAPVLREIKAHTGNEEVELLPLDLTSLRSVRDCAMVFRDRGLPLHILINNAGLAGHRGQTEDGFELQFGVNHLGHFLLTELLIDTLLAGAPARVVNVSSAAHYNARGIDFEAVLEPTRSVTGMPEYSVSKLANVLHAQALAEQLRGRGVTTYSLHPGRVASDIWRRLPGFVRWASRPLMITNEEGALTTLHCATSSAVHGESGLYYDRARPRPPSRWAESQELRVQLQERSLEWVSPFLRASAA